MKQHDPHGIGAVPPASIEVGMTVLYYPVLPELRPNSGVQAVVRSEPWQVGSGHWVVKITGRTGGVSIEHIAPQATP